MSRTPRGGTRPRQAAGARRRGLFYGWWIVAAASLTNGVGGSIHWQGFTVLFLPVSQGLNLTYFQTALPFALSRAEGGVAGPITGWMIDRFGVRPLMLTGTVVVGIGYILLSRTDSYIAFVLVYLFVISIGASSSFMQATTAALNQWFIRRRGAVMGFNSAAFRLGAAVMVPGLSLLVLRFGWHTASLWIGVLMLAAIAPLALVFRRSPETMGLLPDDDPPPSAASVPRARAARRRASARHVGRDDWGVREALRTRAFYVLALGTVLRMSAHGTVFVHMVPMLVWKGQGQQAAANMAGLLALLSVPLVLTLGWLSDRISRQRLLAFSYTSAAASLFLLTVAHGTAPVFFALVLFAGSEAGSALNWALVADLFGRRRFATIRGMLAPMYNTALLISPPAAGWVFDRTGSYRIVLLAGGTVLLLAALTFWNLHAPKRPRNEVRAAINEG